MKNKTILILYGLLFTVLLVILRNTKDVRVIMGIAFGVLIIAMVSGYYFARQRSNKKAIVPEKTIASSLQQPIESPAFATLYVEESLLDGADASAVVAVTVHLVNGNSVGNTWIRQNNNWTKLMEDRVLSGPPDVYILMGELNRLAQAHPEYNGDIHMKVAIMGLSGQISGMLQR